MKLLVDKIPTDYTECMFAREYYNSMEKRGICAMCVLQKHIGTPCVLIQMDNPPCPFLKVKEG